MARKTVFNDYKPIEEKWIGKWVDDWRGMHQGLVLEKHDEQKEVITTIVKETPTLPDKETLYDQFEEEFDGKKAFWMGKETSAFQEWVAEKKAKLKPTQKTEKSFRILDQIEQTEYVKCRKMRELEGEGFEGESCWRMVCEPKCTNSTKSCDLQNSCNPSTTYDILNIKNVSFSPREIRADQIRNGALGELFMRSYPS